MQERPAFAISGLGALMVLILLKVVGIALIVSGANTTPSFAPDGVVFDTGQIASPPLIVAGAIVLFFVLIGWLGFTVVQPNESKVVTFLGRYLGTVRRNGWGWTYPLTSRETVSLRIQNFDSQVLKVNDFGGSPIEVAAVVVWRVVDTAKAAFEVEDYEEFVRIQTETAVRHMTSLYPYDQHEEGQVSLRSHAEEVTNSLNAELQDQLESAGVEVIRTQLRRLAYAPEIAADMLRRQQADAVVAARNVIVEGAVSMVDLALTRLTEEGIVTFDEEKKAAMVSNLLVVLCSEHHAQPVVNTGSLYQ